MNYPLLSEYVESIRSAEDNLAELSYLHPVLDANGDPVMTGGNFAVVFKMLDKNTGQYYALKCFTREQDGRAESYRMIAEELENVKASYLTHFRYYDNELFVDCANTVETEFPVVLMDWVEGLTLGEYIRENIGDQYTLEMLAYQFSRLAMWLLPQPFAHGDLKPDNIIVKDDGSLVLVDYDGIFVPAMKGQKARELGSPDFRHPSRTENDFDEHIDDFPVCSILLSLKAIAVKPDLLEQYGASDRLLFSSNDYRNFSHCALLREIYPSDDAELNNLVSLFTLALGNGTLTNVSSNYFNLNKPDEPEIEILSTIVTAEDLANAWTDEYGVMYSADRKRLLKAPSKLSNYNIRKGTVVICDYAFVGGQDDEEEYIYNINDEPYWGCYSIHEVNIPDSVKIIGRGAFRACVDLNNISIPSSVKYIGENAFESCISIKSITIPDGITSISQGLFLNCELLEKIVAPESIITIGHIAFESCVSLRDFVIPNKVEYIGVRAFKECNSLRTIYIPDSVIKIEPAAFSDCLNLRTIFIPRGSRYKMMSFFRGYEHLLVEI